MINYKVRKYLIDHAITDTPVFYSVIVNECRLPYRLGVHDELHAFRAMLADISRFEHSQGRPLISAMAIYKPTEKRPESEHGDGFYKLSESLGKGDWKKLKRDMYGFDEAARCRDYWRNEQHFHAYYALPEESAATAMPAIEEERGPLVKGHAPAGTKTLPDLTPSFEGTDKDYVKELEEQIALGVSGEHLVIAYEQNRLKKANRNDLAEKVEKVKDGRGYDIASFEEDGTPRFIEVKTTRGSNSTPFAYTITELLFAKAHPKQYFIYRLYNYNDEAQTAEYYVISDVQGTLLLQPVLFKAYYK